MRAENIILMRRNSFSKRPNTITGTTVIKKVNTASTLLADVILGVHHASNLPVGEELVSETGARTPERRNVHQVVCEEGCDHGYQVRHE